MGEDMQKEDVGAAKETMIKIHYMKSRRFNRILYKDNVLERKGRFNF